MWTNCERERNVTSIEIYKFTILKRIFTRGWKIYFTHIQSIIAIKRNLTRVEVKNFVSRAGREKSRRMEEEGLKETETRIGDISSDIEFPFKRETSRREGQKSAFDYFLEKPLSLRLLYPKLTVR